MKLLLIVSASVAMLVTPAWSVDVPSSTEMTEVSSAGISYGRARGLCAREWRAKAPEKTKQSRRDAAIEACANQKMAASKRG